MKKYAVSISLLLFLVSFNQSAAAQIWKKIKNKTQQKLEDKVSEKVSEKLAEVVFKKLSERFSSPSNPYNGAAKISKPDNLPESYSFDWSYKVKMTNTKDKSDDIIFDYKLTESGSYFGYSMEASNEMFSEVDAENEVIVSYMYEEGSSFAIAHAYSEEVFSSAVESTNSEMDENVEITELPNKEYLGFDARGYEIETDESVVVIYVTSEANVNFSDVAKSPNFGSLLNFKNNVEETEDSLMLYMKITSKKDSGYDMEMECIDLKKQKFSKDNSSYKFM